MDDLDRITRGLRLQEIDADRRKLDGLGIDQLEQRIRKDQVLPDTVTLKGRKVDIVDALKNDEFRTGFASRLADRYLSSGEDFSNQIALLSEYDERLNGRTMRTDYGSHMRANQECAVDRVRGQLSKTFGAALEVCNKEDFTTAPSLTEMDRGNLGVVSQQQASGQDMGARTPTSLLGGARG